MCMCAEWEHHSSIRTGTGRAGVRAPGGLPASGGRVGPRRSGSPWTSQSGAQEWAGWGPAHRLPVAPPQHSGPRGDLEEEPRAPGWRRWAGWAGEKSCWPRRLCDAGAKGWEEKEKAEQRRFFSGEWESQEGRQPGRKKRGREMKATAEETSAQQVGAPWGPPTLTPRVRLASQGHGMQNPPATCQTSPLAAAGEELEDLRPGPALGSYSLPSLPAAP